jgi:hypothetical protein
MKIKLQDYCIVSNDFIKALNDYGIPKHFIETIPAEKLADVCFEAGEKRGYEIPALQIPHLFQKKQDIEIAGLLIAIPISEAENPNKQDFLNSEIEIQ